MRQRFDRGVDQRHEQGKCDDAEHRRMPDDLQARKQQHRHGDRNTHNEPTADEMSHDTMVSQAIAQPFAHGERASRLQQYTDLRMRDT